MANYITDPTLLKQLNASQPLSSPLDAALQAEGITGARADIARSIYQQESGSGRNTNTSNAGARGGMQIIPATFDRMADKGWAIDNPVQNARAGVRYVSQLYDKAGGDPQLTAAGYYGGEGAIKKARNGVAVSDPRNPNAPNTLQYAQQVASRLPAKKYIDDPALLAELNAAPQAKPQASPQSPGLDFSLNTDKVAALGQGLKDAAGGFARSGMGLVSNLMRPMDALTGANDPTLSSLIDGNTGKSAHEQRMARVDSRFKQQGYDPNSASFQGTKLGGDVLATLPVGGVLAKGVEALPMLSRAVPALAPALRSGGFTTGTDLTKASLGAKAIDMGTRMVGAAAPAAVAQTAIDGGLDKVGNTAAIAALLPPGLKAAGVTGKFLKDSAGLVAKNVLGASTATGAESISAAYNAGKNKSTDFLDNMRGNTSFNDVVDQAKGALQKMRIDRGNSYRSGMIDISKDKDVIPFQPISEAVNNVSSMGSYKGQQINKNAANTVNDLVDTVSKWGSLNPAEYHTPEGLDALKQAIGDIRDTTQFGTAARRSADTVYNAVKDQITAQAPTYSKVMNDYSEASTALSEVEKALSLGNKTAKDTAIRKLQSVMRNNAQTNYGNRLNLTKTLEDKGGVSLLPAIAGQSMSALMPRGITGAMGKVGAGGAAVLSHGAAVPGLIAAAPFASPRIMGESLYGLGRITGAAGSAAKKGGEALSQLASKKQGLLEAQNAFYRSVPLMATSQRR